jgi:hypothetical protein
MGKPPQVESRATSLGSRPKATGLSPATLVPLFREASSSAVAVQIAAVW